MKLKPKISIVIPNYNHAEGLQFSLRAIVNQTRPADEVVIVDDGSTDHSLDIIQEFAAKFDTIKLLRHENNQGVVAAVNNGVHKASGDYVILASADERIMPDMCEVMENAYFLYPEAPAFVSKFTEWCPRAGVLNHGARNEYDFWFSEGDKPEFISAEKFFSLLQIAHVRISANGVMLKRSTMLEVGVFDENMRWYADFFLMYAIAFRHGICAVPQSLSWFKLSQNSYSTIGTQHADDQRDVMRHFLEKLEQPGFSDLREKFFSAPSSLSAFLRPLLRYMLRHPKHLKALFRLGVWWLKDTLRGNRPGLWAQTDLAGRFRKRHTSSSLRKLNQNS